MYTRINKYMQQLYWKLLAFKGLLFCFFLFLLWLSLQEIRIAYFYDELWRICVCLCAQGKDMYLMLENNMLNLVDPMDRSVLHSQPIASIRVWGVGRDNGRLVGFLFVFIFPLNLTFFFSSPWIIYSVYKSTSHTVLKINSLDCKCSERFLYI